ncbi:MAG: SUMF1/EgtB/PvdO family nonheme iron enzyme, partial [Bacteroidota bacterium]
MYCPLKSIFWWGIIMIFMMSCEPSPEEAQRIDCEETFSAVGEHPVGMVWIPSGRLKDSCIQGFWMDKTPVTVSEFERFVESTGYQTEAERFGDA